MTARRICGECMSEMRITNRTYQRFGDENVKKTDASKMVQNAYAGTLSMGDRDGAVAGARASGVDNGLGDSCNNNGSAGEKMNFCDCKK